MHSLNKDKFRYYAKILMVVSFTFIIYGSVLLYYNRVNYLDPINDYYATDDDDNIISITPSDTNEVVSDEGNDKSSNGNNNYAHHLH